MDNFCRDCAFISPLERGFRYQCNHPLLEDQNKKIFVTPGRPVCDWFIYAKRCGYCKHFQRIRVGERTYGATCSRIPPYKGGEEVVFKKRSPHDRACKYLDKEAEGDKME